MNQYGAQLQEQWTLLDPARARQAGTEFFERQGDLAQTQIEVLTPLIVGPDQTDETYMQKVGRINNARLRATELVMADMPRPVDQDDWEHRFEIWQGRHPLPTLLREFHRTMDEIEDQTPETDQEEKAQANDATHAKASLREDLEFLEIPTDLIEACLMPHRVESTFTPGEMLDLWMTSPETTARIEAFLRPQWEALPEQTREEAWDAPSDGADYYQATQRLMQGLPR